MPDTDLLHFEPFRLDLGAERLWRGSEVVRLTAKAWAVLHYLVDHAEHLVPQEALMQAVWGTPYVSEAALTVSIGEIRRALGDTAQAPRFMETVLGRGYRFVGEVTCSQRHIGSRGSSCCSPPARIEARRSTCRQRGAARLSWKPRQPAFSKPWSWPVANRPNRGSCAPP
jgi:DNA-binding winged helix-turn-helix (wHTH) protein